MNPFSRALSDYHSGSLDAAFTICREDGFCQRVPAATFFESENFPPLELLALDECRGEILDVGSAVGRHSIELLRRGHMVTSLDVLPEMEGIMIARGLTDVVIAVIPPHSTGCTSILNCLPAWPPSMDGRRNCWRKKPMVTTFADL